MKDLRKKTAAVIFSTFLFATSACATIRTIPVDSASSSPPITSADQGFHSVALVPRPPLVSLRHAELQGTWTAGSCSFSFSTNTLTYRANDGQDGSLVLDVRVLDATALVCSDSFTALILPHSVVISLGANPILEGAETFGIIGNGETSRLLLVNSYTVIHYGADGLFVRGEFDGSQLTVHTDLGRRWVVDARNPTAGGRIYNSSGELIQ